MYSNLRRTDQSGAGLAASARKLLVLSASLSNFARFRDKVGDIGSERLLDKLGRDLAVFDGVVKQRGNDQIRIFAVGRFGH